MEARAVASGAIGSALEYFDFAVYGALSATIFPALFFSGLGPTGALLASFATFGIGFVARPFGAVLFGYLGDRHGRRPVLFATLILMGGSSILIGLLPTGQGVGVAAILVGLRFLQGFSLGGEAVGNQLMTMEHGDKSRRGLLGSFIVMGSPISQVIANLSLVVLSSVLAAEQYESWGWRLPFLGSILVVAVAVFIRIKLEETPAFVASQEVQAQAKDSVGEQAAKPQGTGLRVLKTHPLTVAKLTLAWGGPSLAFYLVAVYGLSYLTKESGMSSDTAFLILMVANGVSVASCILGGWLCDRLGRKPVMLIGMAGTFVGILLFFTIAGPIAFVTGLIVTLVLSSVQFLSGSQPAFFAEQFPTQGRFSGAALSHTLANMIFSAPSPFIAAALVSIGGTNLVMAFTMVVLLGSMFAVTRLNEGGHLDLDQCTDVNTALAVRRAAKREL